ncbi:protein of unknown function [Pararobbsia alpina]|uniref:hypothetical protein n=1 Tax=Pararobbsia alpina TaxID=621374 RepID=UPI0039A42C63
MASNWDNVKSISLCHLIVGGRPDGGASMFLNGLHQIPVLLDLSFDLVSADKGVPTESEVRAQITWIESDTGQPLKYLGAVSENNYCQYYDSTGQTTQVTRSGAPQYELSFFFQANKNASPLYSELISLKITNPSNGAEYNASSAASNAFQTSCQILFLPEKKYGTQNSTLTQIAVRTAPQPTVSFWGNNNSDSEVVLTYLQIDDSLFYIHDFTNPSLGYQDLTYIHKEKQKPDTNHWWNSWLVTESPVNNDATLSLRLNKEMCSTSSGNTIGLNAYPEFSVSSHRIYLVWIGVYVEHTTDDYTYYSPVFNINLHDQFGNSATVAVQTVPWTNIIDVT